MQNESPAERAIALLEIHRGSCFVPENSDLMEPFRDMEKAGLVRVSPTGELVRGFNIRSINFTPVIVPADDEAPAH